MAKYLVETYYTCTFKVNHYLDEVNEAELKNLEKRDDGKFEILDVNSQVVRHSWVASAFFDHSKEIDDAYLTYLQIK